MVVFTGQWCWGKKKMKNGETGPATSKKRRKKREKKKGDGRVDHLCVGVGGRKKNERK